MKTRIHSLLALGVLALLPAFGQSADKVNAPPPAAPHLTVFDLDFSGGTPQQLVAAIEKSMGRPINVLIPVEYANVRLPPLKMNRVTVAQLFRAFDAINVPKRMNGFNANVGSSFHTSDAPDRQNDNSIWTFYSNSYVPPTVGFYLLTPCLKTGLTVDDITTAVQTAWRMSGENPAPLLTYHKETNVLIAVGEPEALHVIVDVLNALQPVTKPNDTPKPVNTPAPDEKKT